MIDKIILAGFGGQGVMFIGKLLAISGMLNDLEVCWIPSYGPEMRGGTANCSVILSDEIIYSPVVAQGDVVMALNKPSYDKFLPLVKPGGVMVVNSSIVTMETTRSDITTIAIPATAIAHELGQVTIANVVCLGAMLPYLQLAKDQDIEKALQEEVAKKRPHLLDINLQAIKRGLAFKESI